MEPQIHCVICNVIPEGQRIFRIRIVPSRLAVILLPEQEGLAVPGDRIRAGLGDGIPVIVGIIICPRDFERERFLHIADPIVRGQLQFLYTNTVVGKGMLLTPSRIRHFKFKGLSGRCFRAGLLDMFHDRNLHFDVCFSYVFVSELPGTLPNSSAWAVMGSIPSTIIRQSRMLRSFPVFSVFSCHSISFC